VEEVAEGSVFGIEFYDAQSRGGRDELGCRHLIVDKKVVLWIVWTKEWNINTGATKLKY